MTHSEYKPNEILRLQSYAICAINQTIAKGPVAQKAHLVR
jgi:hypothetical protein